MGNSTGQEGANIYRLGENFQTGYFGPKHAADAVEAEKLIRGAKKGSLGLRDLGKSGNLHGLEDYYLKHLENVLETGQNGIYIRDTKGFNAFMREPLEVASRLISPSSIVGNVGEQRHIMNQAGFQHNTIFLHNLHRLDEAGKDRVMTGLIGHRDIAGRLDPGVGASRIVSDYVEGRQHGLLQLYEGSALQQFRTGAGKANRLTTPVISRLEQVAGRSSRWIGKGTAMGRHGTFGAGAGMAPIEWGSKMTGLTNKAVLLDVTMGAGKGAYASLEGYGQGYVMGGLGTLESDFTVPLLDPKSHGKLSSKLQEYLHGNYQAGKGHEYYEITKAGKLRNAATNELFDPFLGEGPAGMRSLNLDPRAKGVWLGITEANPANNKNQLHVTAKLQREMDRGKLFGVLHKGTAVGVQKPTFMRDLSTYGVDEGWLRSLNIPLNQIVAASGDMLKKAPDFLNVQMISGMGLVSKFDKKIDPFTYVERQIRDRVRNKIKPTFGGNRTGHVADVVMERLAQDLHAGKTSTEDVGRVLAGLYHGSGLAQHHNKDATSAFFSGRFAFDAAALDTRMGQLFGSHYGAVRGVMEKGLALGAGGFSAGTGHGDYGLGRGSVEPRFMEMMSTRLKDMGMSNNDISEFMVGIYKRKIGGQEGMEIVQPLEKMVMSQMSMTGPGGNVPILNIKQFQEAMTKHESFSGFLKTQKDGVFLDFNGANTKGGEILSHAAGERFGGKKQIYFAGGDAMSLMHGTEIKQLGETLQVGSQYERTVDSFAQNLVRLSSSAEEAAKNASQDLFRFKKDIAGLYSHAFVQQSRGKIRGSLMNMMQGYATRSGTGLTRAQTATIQGLMKGSSGQAMFMDHHGFLSMLNDYMGNDKGELLNKYFTSSETAYGQALKGGAGSVTTQAGIMTATMRNPILGYGNTQISQIYRDVYEVGKGRGDAVFSMVKEQNAAALNALEKRTGGKILGWHDIASAKQRGFHGEVDTFFNEMAGNLKKWVRTGGGSIYMPDDRFTVTAGGKVANNVDFAFSGAAIGDFDGDWANTILLDKTTRKKLMSTLQDSGGMEAYMRKNAAVIAQGETYKMYAKETLKAKYGDAGLAEIEAELKASQQDLLKEKGSKRVTGSVDVALNKLKRAVLNSKNQQNEGVANESLALLQMLEEHTTIKGKKLESYKPLGDMLVGAVDRAFEGEGVKSIRDLFENEIFPKTTMGGLYDGLDLKVAAASGSTLPSYVAGANSAKVSLNGVLDFLGGAISNYKAIGGGEAETGNMLAAKLTGGSIDMQQKAMQDIVLAETSGVQAGMAASYGRSAAKRALGVAEGAWGRVVGAAGKVDARMAGLVTLGLGAGAALVGMSGIDPHDSTPIMAAGEMPSAYVQKGIGSFNLLDQSSAGHAGGGPVSDPYDMINTPMNMGTTYVGRNNGYNIRGESGSMAGTGAVSSYLAQLTRGFGRGSIQINDMRRPITSNYVDRLTGEY
jgi:hypothetical protein